MMFLTEEGLYRLLMISRKPIARPFQKWVTKVLVAIRENGKYELEHTVQDIGSTVVSATVQKGLVAMLDLDKKCVVQVFMDQKDAAEKRHFTGCAAISNAIKRGSKLSGPTTSCPKSAATARESISCIDRGCHHRDAHGAQVPDERDRVPGRRQGLQVAFLFVTKVK